MADGRLNKCKVCTRKDVGEHRAKHLDRIREYDRIRYSKPEGMARLNATCKAWLLRNPEKRRAHCLVDNAIRCGKLVRGVCERCGNPKSHGHHEDYARPLDVIWLCAPCHSQRHKEIAREAAALEWAA